MSKKLLFILCISKSFLCIGEKLSFEERIEKIYSEKPHLIVYGEKQKSDNYAALQLKINLILLCYGMYATYNSYHETYFNTSSSYFFSCLPESIQNASHHSTFLVKSAFLFAQLFCCKTILNGCFYVKKKIDSYVSTYIN